MSPRVLVVHGPGLDLQRRGLRTPPPGDLAELDARCRDWGAAAGLDVVTRKAAEEVDLVAVLTGAAAGGDRGYDAIVVTAGDLAFSSRPLARTVARAGVPVVDLHAGDLRRAGRSPTESLLHRAGALTVHGRGADGHRDAIAHLGHLLAHPPESLAYGRGVDHVGDLRVPPGEGPHPVVVLLHGGFWYDPWGRDLMDGVAVDLLRRGAATWNVEYRRLGGGGGWPASARDVAAAVAHLGVLAATRPLDLGRVVLVGHSAGGQLALVAAGGVEPRRPLTEPPPVTTARVVSLAGLVHLRAAAREGLGGNAVRAYLGQAGAEALHRASPIERLPLGVPQVIAHSSGDTVVPVGHSVAYAHAARRAGDAVVCHEEPDGDHFALIDPTSDAWHTVVPDILPI